MRYTVRYAIQDQRREVEVEASGPHEAVVKFQHMAGWGRQQDTKARVLGVSQRAEEAEVWP